MAELRGISDQLLQSLVPDALGSFNTGVQGAQQNILGQQGIEQGQQGIQLGQQGIDLNQLKLAQGELQAKGQEANALLTAKTPEQLRAMLVRRAQELTTNPVPGVEAEDLIDMANRLGEPNGFQTIQAELKGDLARVQDIQKAFDQQFGAPELARVQSSQILPDGTVIKVLSDQTTQVESPTGELLTGQARADAIKTAQQFGAELAGSRAGEKVTGAALATLRANINKETIGTLRSAPREIAKLKGLAKVFERADTGSGTAFLSAVGTILPGATPASLEDALSASGQFILNALNQIKGPITEKELAFISTIGPAVRNSPEGNKLIIKRAVQAIQDELDLANAQRKWVAQGNNPEDFDTEGFIAERESTRDAIIAPGQGGPAGGVTPGGIDFEVVN